MFRTEAKVASKLLDTSQSQVISKVSTETVTRECIEYSEDAALQSAAVKLHQTEQKPHPRLHLD